MIEATAREAKTRCNIVWLQVRQLFEHLLTRQAGRHQIEDIRDPNPHAANVWTTVTLLSVHRDPIEGVDGTVPHMRSDVGVFVRRRSS
jgi:hypothetical protein